MMINHRQHDGKVENNHMRMKGSKDSDDGITGYDDEGS